MEMVAVPRKLPGFSSQNQTYRTARAAPLPFFNILLNRQKTSW
jgi:hypothetical protein